MACLTLTVAMTIFMSVIFLLLVKTGLGMKQISICNAICSGSDCITVNQESVDFKTAEEACTAGNGELMTLKPLMDERSFGDLSHVLFGHYWIGLRLPAGSCSNLSAPLRGYEWTSGDTHQSFIPSSNIWKDNVQVCSLHCVSLSNDQKLTERPCSDKTDGYLCRTKHKDACRAQELSDSNVIQDPRGCSTGPCSQKCKDVRGGYICLCFDGYIQDPKDHTQCNIHCENQTCPLVCDSPGTCSCPIGYIDNEGVCEDYDECDMKECQQKCKNTLGSFVCSCEKGFILKDQVNCILANNNLDFVITTPNAEGSGKPNNSTLKVSSPSGGGFVWMWIFGAAAVVVFIFVVRLYVVKCHKRRQQNSHQQSTATAPVANIEC